MCVLSLLFDLNKINLTVNLLKYKNLKNLKPNMYYNYFLFFIKKYWHILNSYVYNSIYINFYIINKPDFLKLCCYEWRYYITIKFFLHIPITTAPVQWVTTLLIYIYNFTQLLHTLHNIISINNNVIIKYEYFYFLFYNMFFIIQPLKYKNSALLKL